MRQRTYGRKVFCLRLLVRCLEKSNVCSTKTFLLSDRKLSFIYKINKKLAFACYTFPRLLANFNKFREVNLEGL